MTDLALTPHVGDPELDDEDPIFSHIVGPVFDDDGNKIQGRTRVLEAAVNGTPITALCGYTWVPTRDPERHPLCERCRAIAERGPEDVE